jgi:hypothetical protein
MFGPFPITPRLQQALLIAVLGFGVLVRLNGIFTVKEGLSNDESITIVGASAKEGAYLDTMPALADTLITTGTVQAFFARPQRLDLATVAYDMVHRDNHPPLYFWMLHVLHFAFGLQQWTGPLLNLVLGLGILWLLILLARKVFQDTTLALVVAVVWYLAPAVMQIDLEARHYQLFGLLALASFMLGERLADGRGSIGTWSLFIGVNTAGLLTHYYFAALLLPCTLIMLMRHGSTKPTLLFVGSLLLSGLLCILLFPDSLDFVGIYLARPPLPSPPFLQVLWDRIRTTLYATLAFLSQPHALRYLYLLLSGIFAIVAFRELRRPGACGMLNIRTPIGHQSFNLLWAAFFTVLVYLLGISPAQAAGDQYYAYFWPLLALALVYLCRLVLPARILPFVFVLHALQLLVFAPSAIRASFHVPNLLPIAWYAEMAEAELLVTDEERLTGLPRILWYLPNDQILFIVAEDRPELEGIRNLAFLQRELEHGQHPFASQLIADGWSYSEERSEFHRLYRFVR